jgi:glycosyltransferase involved in cell wall biosynthesis
VLVLPSDFEPWAVVVQEAMAAGLVVVASDSVGSAHELIADGRSGRIFPTGDLGALQRALLEVSAADALSGYKQRSREALDQWRNNTNPVTEIRRALADFGVLKRG